MYSTIKKEIEYKYYFSCVIDIMHIFEYITIRKPRNDFPLQFSAYTPHQKCLKYKLPIS
jgi:hypothetical protein